MIRLSDRDLELVAEIQGGLPLVPRPYAAIGATLGMSEQEVIDRLGEMIERGVIKRMGVIVRHRELGYRANAMVVWDVADDRINELGERLGQYDFVTLCYQRPRRLPDWPYNLFCMIHGQNHQTVRRNIERLIEECELQHLSSATLFSRRRFKQRGAIYVHELNSGEPMQSTAR